MVQLRSHLILTYLEKRVWISNIFPFAFLSFLPVLSKMKLQSSTNLLCQCNATTVNNFWLNS